MKLVYNMKRISPEIPEIVMALFSIWIVSTNNVFLLNIFVIVYMLFNIVLKKGGFRVVSKPCLAVLGLYYAWVAISVLYTIIGGRFDYDVRNLVQITFELEYLIIIIKFGINYKTYFKWFIRLAWVYSIIVIYLFISRGYLHNIIYLYTTYRDWTADVLPVPSTSGPIPLIMALFLSLVKKEKTWKIALITIGTLLFASRVCILGVILVYGYYVWKMATKKQKRILLVLIPIGIVCSVVGFRYWSSIDNSLLGRLLMKNDRLSIMDITIEFFKKHPLVGYGGNTLDRIIIAYKYKLAPGAVFQHTHNFILEILIRYGLIGLILFLSFLLLYASRIRSKHAKYMFFVFLVFGLFQTYMREFYFIFFLSLLYEIEDETDWLANLDILIA